MSALFDPRPELRIGKILEVNGSSLRIELDRKISELTRSIDGRVYPVGQMASIIKIHFGRKILFAYVRMLRMRSDLLAEEGKAPIEAGDDSRILEADLFGEGSWSNKSGTLNFSRGVETYPLPLQDAFLCLNEELENIYRGAEGIAEAQTISPMIPIGNYIGSNNAICRANIDKLFGHHCAILGSTGSGKSGTVASIIHSVLDYQIKDESLSPRIIMIDPHGEYAAAFNGKNKDKNKAVVYKAYNEASISSTETQQLKLPYWLMSSDELRSLIIGKTEYEASSQNNVIYEALSYARMQNVGIVKNLGDDPSGEAELEPEFNKSIDDILSFDRDKPLPFELSEFVKHIDKVQGRAKGTKKDLSFTDRNKNGINSILKKLRILRANPQLSFIMDELTAGSPTLDEVLSQFVGVNDTKYLRIIDISGLPNEAAGPLTALIARLLFQYKLWQTKEERKSDPILFVCEEAHRYVPNHGEAQYKEAQEAVRRIAKEGRKYGIGLMLVSQRPSDVESTVLSQCNSWLILRLTNSNDQQHVAKFLPDSLAGLTSMLSALTRREALFVGEAAALPSRIRINKLPLEKLPDSHDISFIEGWINKPTTTEKLKEITDKWTGKVESSAIDMSNK